MLYTIKMCQDVSDIYQYHVRPTKLVCTVYNLLFIIYNIYCRASHTGDAGRGRGRERERGMSSELANMTC